MLGNANSSHLQSTLIIPQVKSMYQFIHVSIPHNDIIIRNYENDQRIHRNGALVSKQNNQTQEQWENYVKQLQKIKFKLKLLIKEDSRGNVPSMI